MKTKILFLAAAAAMAFTAASCSKSDNSDNGGQMCKITINGQSGTVKKITYDYSPGNTLFEPHFSLTLYKNFDTPAQEYVYIEISESLIGKTINLTNSLNSLGLDTELTPTLVIMMSEGDEKWTSIDYFDYSIDVFVSNNDSDNVVVTGGTLHVTRDGDNQFAVKLSMTLSDGQSTVVNWAGMAVAE